MPQQLDRDWLTSKQACEYLQISIQTLRKRIMEGKLTGKQTCPGGSWRISAASIDQFMKGG